MNSCLQKYTTHQFTYFIYYLHQDKFKNPKIMKIQQVHQSYQENMIEYLEKFYFYLNCI